MARAPEDERDERDAGERRDDARTEHLRDEHESHAVDAGGHDDALQRAVGPVDGRVVAVDLRPPARVVHLAEDEEAAARVDRHVDTAVRGINPPIRQQPRRTNVRNPGRAASRRYGPKGRFEKRNEPVSLVTALRLMPVSVCVAVTSTPGRTALL